MYKIAELYSLACKNIVVNDQLFTLLLYSRSIIVLPLRGTIWASKEFLLLNFCPYIGDGGIIICPQGLYYILNKLCENHGSTMSQSRENGWDHKNYSHMAPFFYSKSAPCLLGFISKSTRFLKMGPTYIKSTIHWPKYGSS